MITLTIYGLGTFHDNAGQIIAQLSNLNLKFNDLEIQYFNLLDNDLYDKKAITLGTMEFLAGKGYIWLNDFIEPIIFKGNKLCSQSI